MGKIAHYALFHPSPGYVLYLGEWYATEGGLHHLEVTAALSDSRVKIVSVLVCATYAGESSPEPDSLGRSISARFAP